jgi:hypothetical protein
MTHLSKLSYRLPMPTEQGAVHFENINCTLAKGVR